MLSLLARLPALTTRRASALGTQCAAAGYRTLSLGEITAATPPLLLFSQLSQLRRGDSHSWLSYTLTHTHHTAEDDSQVTAWKSTSRSISLSSTSASSSLESAPYYVGGVAGMLRRLERESKPVREAFGLPSSEFVLDSFDCALNLKQGSLYLTTNYLVSSFISYYHGTVVCFKFRCSLTTS